MDKYPYDEILLAEIEDAIDIDREFSDKKKVPIIFDGNQYTIKIPKKLADKVGILKGDEFEFETRTQMQDAGFRSDLLGRLTKNGPTQK